MEQRGYKNHFCSSKCSCEYNKNINQNILPKKRQEEYYKNPKKCLYCHSIISYEKKNDNFEYCSRRCAAIHTQKDGGHCKWDDDDKERIREQSKKNPYFNGTIKKYPKLGKDIICPICNNTFYKSRISKKICCSKKCSYEYIKKNNIWKNGKHGGYRQKGGRGKQGWYKGYFCNSSWELAWVIYQLDKGFQFKRNTKGFEYEFDKKKYKFYPDFILDNGEYVEIKAYIDAKNFAKISMFPYKLNVIGKKDITPFIQYTEEKYGKDYIKLYEPKIISD